MSFSTIAESIWTLERSRDVNGPSHLIGFRLHKVISKCCCWEDRRFTFHFLYAAVCQRDCATHIYWCSPYRASQNSQQALLLGGWRYYFPVSGCSCVSMRLRNINLGSPQEVSTLYFFSLHPMACVDDTWRNIQHT